MIKMKFISEEILEKITKTLKSAGNWLLIVITASSAFFLGYYYPKIKQTVLGEQKTFISPKTSKEITVSVTDRGELMVMDRSTGKFEIYEEMVGLNVFKAYGNRITQIPAK
jgi:hypothetical protein